MLPHLIGFLKGGGHLSYTTLQALLGEGLGVAFRRGCRPKFDKVRQAHQ